MSYSFKKETKLEVLKGLTKIEVKSQQLLEFYMLHICGLFQNVGVASTSYVLRVRFAATERVAKTANC